MAVDIEHYKDLAQQKQKEHRKFLAGLKKKAPKNLDKIAQEIHTEVFQEIDCTQCANCCKSLGGKIPPACGKSAAQPLRSDCVGFK